MPLGFQFHLIFHLFTLDGHLFFDKDSLGLGLRGLLFIEENPVYQGLFRPEIDQVQVRYDWPVDGNGSPFFGHSHCILFSLLLDDLLYFLDTKVR